MKHALPLLTAAAGLLLSSTAAAQTQDITDLYSTGVDASEMPVAFGTQDTNWEVQENALGWQPAVYDYGNFSQGNWIDWPLGDDAVSRPLVHPSWRQMAPGTRLFSWRQSFTLPANADLSTVTISYRVGYDDVSRNDTDTGDLMGCNHVVWVNGVAVTPAVTGTDNQRTECEATLPANTTYAIGQNTLEFRIQNLATYHGFRFEKIQATYEPISCGGELAVFSTGVDAAAMPVAFGTQDAHWEVQEDALGFEPAVYDYGNFYNGGWNDWPLGNSMASRPLVHPDYRQVTPGSKKFTWRQSFDIPAGADLGTIKLRYNIGYDDLSRNLTDTGNLNGCAHVVWVNGTAIQATNISGTDNQRTQCEAEVPAGANWQVGSNTIEFRIQNLSTYYGFRFETLEASYEQTSGPRQLDTFYATGVDANGTPISLMDTDPHWEVQEDALGWRAAVYDYGNFSQGSWIDWPLGDDSASRPLVHPDWGQQTPGNKLFSWRQSFMIPLDAKPDTVTISYEIGYDDVSRNLTDTGDLTGCDHVVWVNGVAVQATNISGTDNQRTQCEAAIPAGSNFQTGMNTVEFRIQNLATYHGFRWEKLSATARLGSVIPPTPDTTPPTVTIGAPMDGAVVDMADTTVTGMTEAGATVTVVVEDMNGDAVQEVVTTADDMGNFSADVTGLADGAYTLEVTATDAAGNGQTETADFTVAIFMPMPAAAITSPSNDEVLTDPTPTIAGTATDLDEVTVVLDGNDAGTAPVDMSGMWTFTPSTALAPGAHTVVATFLDADGNMASSNTVMFVIEEEQMMIRELVITSPSEGEEVSSQGFRIEGKAEPGTTVVIEFADEMRSATVGGGDDTAEDSFVLDWGMIRIEYRGQQTITVTGAGDQTATVSVVVLDDGTPGDNNGMGSNNGTGTGNNDTGGTPTPPNSTEDEGCSTTGTSHVPTGALWLLGVFGLIVLRRRRTSEAL